jgi:hypothetical protein
MDAGSFVIALLTAAGAAAGPAAIGALPDATASTARCITAPDEERSGSARSDAEVLAQRRADSDVGRADRDTNTSSSALAEALAQELADVVADSDDPTFQRLADALAAAGFEPNADDRQETTASRSDGDRRDDTRLGDSRSDRTRLDDQLAERDGRDERDGSGRSGSVDDRRDRDQQSNSQRGDDRLGRNQDEERGCDGQGADQGTRANRSGDLEDVLSGGSDRERGDSRRSSAPVERGGSGIADVLERGERTTG